MDITILAPTVRYHFQCFDPQGNLRWEETISNLVTTAGKTDLMQQYLSGSGYTATWFVGLIDAAAYAAVAVGDTMASHAGWVEGVPYSNATRPAVTWAAAAAGSKAASTYSEFLINASLTVRGAFMNSVSTKSGTLGVLYSAAAFSVDRIVSTGDSLRVTPTMTAA